MADTISVLARLGPFVESVHRVHAVAVRAGKIVEVAGDPELVCSLRSSAKPFQALSLVRARDDLDDADVAIASASHRAEPEQLDAARRLLAKAPAEEGDLACGHDPRNGGSGLLHNCSGKHAGMLATCRARGWPIEGYHREGHPLQVEIQEEVAAAAELRVDELETAVDGCGVVCFALPLERAAHMFSRLEGRDGGAAVADAMRARPDLVGDRDADDTLLMQAHPGWIAKRGAEALFCAAGPGGLGVALKVEDGGYRATRPAIGAFFERLGYPLPDFAVVPVANSRGEHVGDLVAGPPEAWKNSSRIREEPV